MSDNSVTKRGTRRPACPRCGTWSPGDAVGDGSVLVCRVCAARGVTVVLQRVREFTVESR